MFLLNFFKKQPASQDDKANADKKNEPLHPLLGHTDLMPLIKSSIKDEKEYSKKVTKFLQHVAYGEQDEAEAMLRENPLLVLSKGNVTDYSGREFQNVTGFQYALWALDAHMWNMIKQYIPSENVLKKLKENIANEDFLKKLKVKTTKEDIIKKMGLDNDIKTQFKEVEDPGVTYGLIERNEKEQKEVHQKTTIPAEWSKEDHKDEAKNKDEASHPLLDHRNLMGIVKEYADIKTESHYGFQLIEALEKFTGYVNSTREKRESDWSKWVDTDGENAEKIWKEVGGAQRLMPAHVANWYCKRGREYENHDFSTKNKLPRTFKFEYTSRVIFPLDKYSDARLGFDFGIYRGSGYVDTAGTGEYEKLPVYGAHKDLQAMIALRETRYEDLDQLKTELGLQQQPSPQPHR